MTSLKKSPALDTALRLTSNLLPQRNRRAHTANTHRRELARTLMFSAFPLPSQGEVTQQNCLDSNLAGSLGGSSKIGIFLFEVKNQQKRKNAEKAEISVSP
ncbi:MAG: hypothetical protein IT443_06055 [Phycisphaeraceae bacterium]|nr:hypothetical protein [Phycisphaeraceae bacterium]